MENTRIGGGGHETGATVDAVSELEKSRRGLLS